MTVFGCGGDRDRSKRPVMGSIAEKYSDRVIITNDNPRSEEESAIAAEIARGMKEDSRMEIILDRESAIRRAFEITDVGDIIVIAGKGHERYMEIKGHKYPYNDCDVLAKITR